MNFAHRLHRRAMAAREAVAARHPEKTMQQEKAEAQRAAAERFFEEPYSSTGASLFSMFMMTCILMSTVFFCLETLPSLEAHPLWLYTEYFFVVVFTLEYVTRLFVTSKKLSAFVTEFMNVIDLAAILPFYVELLMMAFISSHVQPPDLRFLRALRLIRIFKVGRYSEDLLFIVSGFAQSISSFYLMGSMLVLGVAFFSSMLWLLDRGEWDAEKGCYVRTPEPHYTGCSPYQHVPNSFWWAVTTMSTVGYGDAFPISHMGRFVAGVAMVGGILCVALPATVLSVEFSMIYQATREAGIRNKNAKKLIDLSKEELELLDKIRAMNNQCDKLKTKGEYMKLLMTIQQKGKKDEAVVGLALDMLSENALQSLRHLKVYVNTIADKGTSSP